MEPETNTAPIWVLLGAKHGDNQQLLAIAEALNLPFRTIALQFNRLVRQAPVLLGASRLSWHTDVPLEAPWPRALLAAGRKSVPAARWIRQQSGGRTRLIHVNRPWAPLAWFDLIVSTPQYALPERPNVLANLLPFVRVPKDAMPHAALPIESAALPRPWTGVLVGGKSRPFVLNDNGAADLAKTVNALVRKTGGSAWILGSPRTPSAAMQIVEQDLTVPSHVVRWGQGENLYGAVLDLVDSFVVTSDSASMLTDALLTGRPVTRFELPLEPDLKWRIASAWRAAALHSPGSMIARSFEAAVNIGLLSSVRDLGRLHRALNEAGLFSPDGQPRELAESERRRTLDRIARVIEGA